MKSTPEMRARLRDLTKPERDDYDRAVECVLDDFDAMIIQVERKDVTMKAIFVVLGMYGEYESATTYVSGVFETRDAAQTAIDRARQKRADYERWSEACHKNWPPLPMGYFKFPLAGDQIEEHAALVARAEAAAGPKPVYESMEDAEIFEVKIGEWASVPPDPLPAFTSDERT